MFFTYYSLFSSRITLVCLSLKWQVDSWYGQYKEASCSAQGHFSSVFRKYTFGIKKLLAEPVKPFRLNGFSEFINT